MSVKHFNVSLSLLIMCFAFANVLGTFDLTDRAQRNQITTLPGLKFQPKFRQFSGYLNGEANKQQLFYWFVESQDRPQVDPLIIWLSGGPGCSSLTQVMQGNGPYKLDDKHNVYENIYSWNKQANILYLESPVDTGYSYGKNSAYISDITTMDNNIAAIHDFLKIYPKYSDHEFFIAGDDHGGIFVPMLAWRILKQKKMNLQGVAIGNGLSNKMLDVTSLIYYMHNHGLLSDKFWKILLKACCANTEYYQCDFISTLSIMCQKLRGKILNLYSNGLNDQNLYGPCESRDRLSEPLDISDEELSKISQLNTTVKTTMATINGITRQHRLRSMVDCRDNTALEQYFNLYDTRQALHVRSQSVRWTQCSNKPYSSEIDDASHYYQFLLDHKVRILTYNGDIDMTHNYMGQEWFVDRLKLKLKYKYRKWYYTDENNWKQIAGFSKTFFKDKVPLTFATIRGAGMMVPKDKPKAALRMITRFLKNKNL